MHAQSLRSASFASAFVFLSWGRVEAQPGAPAQAPPPAVAPAAAPPPAGPPLPPIAAPPPYEYTTPPLTSGPIRHGFTFELGLGAALTYVIADDYICAAGSGFDGCGKTTETQSHFGLAPLSLGIGGFVSPQIALMFRSTGSSYFQGGEQWTSAVYGFAVQYWPSDIVMLSGGPGVAVFSRNAFFSASGSDSKSGFGFFARAGVSVANYTHHSLRLSVEFVPAFYDGGRVLGTTGVFEWQYF